jgi:TolB-like protein/Tfp pilus assembly protein PilF/tRNA A-37 threonylcarbamoyl transferase component Bud32
MTREEWVRVKEVAAEALARPGAERPAYVDARCGDDARLRREVHSLLHAVAKATPFYERPGFTTDALVAIAERDESPGQVVGTRIGAYEILREIGRGGMGAAYLAVRADQAYEKRVAIKLIKRGMDTDAILRRFRHERQILANLEHPNIVMLLDGGTTPDGLPYFVMEYVEGLPIDTFCDARSLAIADRLKLFQAVCAAVHHAHQCRVIHRDLKPSNILVTPGGVPKLLDFGIATLLDSDQTVRTGGEPTVMTRAMTPEYASPEQVRGEPLSTASDVYSLGVLLYVLLAGRPPYELAERSLRDIERAVCEEMPPTPSAVVDAAASRSRGERPERLQRRLSGDLDAIALTALRKEPGRRFASANALADDIQRHLDGLPIAARGATLGYHLISFIRRRRAAVGAVAASILTAIVLWSAPFTRTPGVAAPPQSIAVLPLETAGADPDLESLADGVTEDIIERLSRLPQLKVIGRDSAYRFKGKEVDARVVGRDLRVDAILTGRIEQRGTDLSITAELVDARDRRRLWGDRYQRTVGDIQSVQSDLARQIAANLRLPFPDAEQRRLDDRHTENDDAYRAYLKGRYFWNKRTAAGMRTSVGHFRDAIEKDPSFALAYAGLADSFSLLTEYHALPAKETYAEARSAAMKAVEIGGDLAEAHTSLAYVKHFYEWDWPAAEQEYLRALELNPNYATAHQWYAEYLSAMGRHDEALAEIRKAAEVDPLSLIVNAVEAHLLYFARRYDEAIEQARRVIELEPNFPEVYEYLKRSYDQKGLYKEAIAARQTRRRLLGLDAADTPALVAAAAATSPRAYWEKRLEQEIAESRTEGVQPYELAEILAQAGDSARALDWLERACDDRDFMMMNLRVAPNLDPLRAEPRYQALLRRSCRV